MRGIIYRIKKNMLPKYIFVCIFFVQIFDISIGSEGPSNYVFEDEILKISERLRKILKEGDPENGLGPLEPLKLKNVKFDFYLDDTEVNGTLGNTTISYVSDFQVKNLTINITPKMELHLAVLFDRIDISGHYNLLGTLFGEYPVKGVGTHKIKLKELTLQLDAIFRSKALVLQVSYLNMTIDLQGLSISYKNFLEGDHEQSCDQDFLFHLLDRFRGEYLPRLVNTLKIIVNDHLRRIFSTEYISRITL